MILLDVVSEWPIAVVVKRLDVFPATEPVCSVHAECMDKATLKLQALTSDSRMIG